jgi:hypothetical protein
MTRQTTSLKTSLEGENLDLFRRRLQPAVIADDLVVGLPYGIWRTDAGELILFDRRYQPIFTRRSDGIVVRERANRWVQGIAEQFWFYGDATSPRHDKGTRTKVQGILAGPLPPASSGQCVRPCCSTTAGLLTGV